MLSITNCGDKLGYWIEVTTGIRWQRMLNEREIKLDAPNRRRYQTCFKNMKSGDVVLHYLIGALVPSGWEEKRSCIVAVSKVVSNPQVVGKKIVAKCSRTLHLLKPIPHKALEKIEKKSEELKKLLRVSMMMYLTNISESDYKSIIKLFPQNKGVAKKFWKS